MGNWRLRTYPIPARSWRQAQQPCAIGSRIGAVVVEGFAIEFWDRQGTCIVKTTLTRVSDFLSIDATEAYFIPLCSRRRAQQSCSIRSRIGEVVGEGFAIEFWDRHGSCIVKTTLTRVSDFLSIDATETYFIPLRSWRRAQQSPATRLRIGAVAVEESAIELLERQHSI